MKTSSIGIMRLSALGDIVWIIPLIRCLQKNYPQVNITLFIDHSFAALFDGISDIKIFKLKKPRSLKDYFNIRKILKNFEFDIFLCTQANLRVNLIYPMINAKRKIGFDSQRGRDGHKLFVNEQIPFKKEHSLDAFLGFAHYLGIDNYEVEFNIPVAATDIAWAKNHYTSDTLIVIHPKASSVQRTWSRDNYARLIDELNKIYVYDIVLTGAPADKDFNDDIISLCHKPPKNLAGVSNLKQLATLFSLAKLVVAPDSGPIHLAQAMGAITVGLYAAVSPEYTGPYNQTENCIDAYPLAVKKNLNKDSNTITWRTRVRADGIMDLISVEQVLEKVKSLLDKLLS